MEQLVRKNIRTITPYIGGKPIEELKRELGFKSAVKLASNENPLGPSPKALAQIRKNLAGLNRYPDSSGFYLKKKISRHFQLDKSCGVVLGNGSDELIDIIIKTFVEEDESVLTSEITFLEYEIISRMLARQVNTVPLRYFKYDLEAFKKKLDKKTKVIFLSNPNNPTGTYLANYELDDFLRCIPDNVILVIDEAYDTFIDVNDFPYALGYVKNNCLARKKGMGRKNIIVLKTFSKAYGLAGLRIGYAVANSELALYMEKARLPFNVNSLAQCAAAAALDDEEFLRKTRKIVLEGKQFIYDSLSRMGIAYVPSVTNFVLIDTGKDGDTVFNEMLKYGVIVRDMKQYGLKNFIRVTIGTKKENERFIKVLRKVLYK